MWFLNKDTKLKWYITDKELQSRLLKSEEYEVVKENAKTNKTEETAKEEVKPNSKKKSPTKGK